jgi:hypothetical protein
LAGAGGGGLRERAVHGSLVVGAVDDAVQQHPAQARAGGDRRRRPNLTATSHGARTTQGSAWEEGFVRGGGNNGRPGLCIFLFIGS